MSKPTNVVNPVGSFAPLRNVTLALETAYQLIDRPPGVDGLGLFYGPSGYGKSRASQYVQNKLNAVYIEVFDYWSKRFFISKLLTELGASNTRGTIAEMMERALLVLQDDPNRLLIIDEADKLVDKGMIELVRGLYKGARIPVLLVGEERLPDKLAAYERCQNRVTAFAMAESSDVSDAGHLARVYHPRLTIGDDLLAEIVAKTKGVTSRIVTTLASVSQFAMTHGLTSISAAEYSDGPVFTGQPPRRRA